MGVSESAAAACSAESHAIPGRPGCAAVSMLHDHCTWTGSSTETSDDDGGPFETASDVEIVCGNTTELLMKKTVKSRLGQCITEGDDCISVYSGGTGFNPQHAQVGRHIVGVGTDSSEACSVIIAEKHVTATASDSWDTAMKGEYNTIGDGADGFVLAAPSGFTEANDMIVRSEYICSKSLAIVWGPKWQTPKPTYGADDPGVVNAFADPNKGAGGSGVPSLQTKIGSKEVDTGKNVWNDKDFEWTISVQMAQEEDWKDICTSGESKTISVPSAHALDVSVLHDRVVYVSYDPAKSTPAELHISTLSGISDGKDCGASADVVKIPLPAQQDCSEMDESSARKGIKNTEFTFKEVCAANYFVELSDDGTTVRVGLNYDRVWDTAPAKAMFSVYTLGSSSGSAVPPPPEMKTTTMAAAYTAASPTSKPTIAPNGLRGAGRQVSCDEDFVGYGLISDIAGARRQRKAAEAMYQPISFDEGVETNFKSSGDMTVVVYDADNDELNVRLIGGERVCKLTCKAFPSDLSCDKLTLKVLSRDVKPVVLASTSTSHVLWVTHLDSSSKKTDWRIDLSADGNLQTNDGKPCVFSVVNRNALKFWRAEPTE